jgi:hypothetical protein
VVTPDGCAASARGMPNRTLWVLPWSCLESLEPVRARVFGRTNARRTCALGFMRVRIRLRRFGRSLPSSLVHAYRYENAFLWSATAGGQDLQSGRHVRLRSPFFVVSPAPPAQPGPCEPQQHSPGACDPTRLPSPPPSTGVDRRRRQCGAPSTSFCRRCCC